MTNLQWNLWPDKEPKAGDRCIGLYKDGSGSILFYVDDRGYIRDADGDDYQSIERFDESVLYWALLPEGFKFWGEEDE
jgi:hypothetical protein